MKTKSLQRPSREEPEILEIRRARARLWKQGGGTLAGVMELLRLVQASEKAGGRPTILRKKPVTKTIERKKRKAA